jgi:Leucine-rich repeat (LRR) protein
MAHDEAYYQAEKKIEEALKSGATELDLGNKKLTELPESIGHLKQLKSLNLFSNQLTELPSEIWQLTNLTELCLRDNYIIKLPPEISFLTKLTILDLRNNMLTELPLEIGKLKNLIELGLRDNNLTKLPQQLGYLNDLVVLDLRNNSLTKLPPVIGKLKKITSLILYDNHLTELPPEIGQLSSLTDLDFGRDSSETSVLGGNKLERLPPEIGQLDQLTSLSISKNKLAEIPTEIGQLINLTELDLSNNKLTELPAEIGKLNHLTKLNIGNDSSLRELLAAIKEASVSTKYSLNIDVWENGILEQGIKFRKFHTNSDVVLNLLKKAVFDYADLERVDRDALGDMFWNILQKAQFEYSILIRNKFTKLPPEILQLNNLTELKVHNNQIAELPAEIKQLSNLTILSISGNRLAKLPPEIGQLNRLIELDLDDNLFRELPPQIGQLTNLTKLSIKNNQLADLPLEIGQLKKLNELYLDNNPLNSELAEAYKQGVDAVQLYLRAGPVIKVHEAKLILVGEGEVGKTCLLSALCDEPFVEGLPSTHGVDIKLVKLTVPYAIGEPTYLESPKKPTIPDALLKELAMPEAEEFISPTTQTEITLNAWDFGGQRVYRPTHQLFFSAPAVYLVVWSSGNRAKVRRRDRSRNGFNSSSAASRARRFSSSPRMVDRSSVSPILTVRNCGTCSARKPS